MGRMLLMQSSRNWKVGRLILVQPTSPREPGETRPPSKKFGCKSNTRKGDGKKWCRMFKLLVRKEKSWPNPFIWPLAPKQLLVGLNVGCILYPTVFLL